MWATRTAGTLRLDASAVAVVVVLRPVQRAAAGQLQRRVVQQAGRREQPLLQRQRVDKRLDGAAGLAPRQHRVDIRGPRAGTRRAHPGQHLAAGVVQHQHRAIFGVAAAQLGQLAAQRGQRHTLHGGVQRAVQGLWGLRVLLLRRLRWGVRDALRLRPLPAPQLLRQVRRQALAGGRAGAARQRLLDGRAQAFAAQRLLLQHGAGAALQQRGRRVGRAHHGRQDGGFQRVQPAGVLAEQLLRGRGHAHQFAAQRHVVEVGLEDLRLAPLRLQRPRPHHLRHLAADAAAAGRARQLAVQQAGQLHGQRGRAACLLVPGIAPGAGGQRLPVHAAVVPEAAVFAQHQRVAQRGRHVGQGQPRAAAHLGVDAQHLQRHAVAAEQRDVGRCVRLSHSGEAGDAAVGGRRCLRLRLRRALRPRGQRAAGQRACRAQRDQAAARPAPLPHGCTSQAALGSSPNDSGAYMASTRVGGRPKRPLVLRRSVYSTTCLPRGIQA
jgi:hypothetical protein